MVVPFSDFAVPPVLYVAVLGSMAAILIALLYTIEAPLTQRIVLSMVPWVVCGAALHVFYQLGAIRGTSLYPAWAAPLFAAPMVYVTTFVGMGLVWLGASMLGTHSSAISRDSVATYIGSIGTGIALPLLALLVWQGMDPATGTSTIVLPLLGLIASLVVSFVVYMLLGAWRTYIIAETRQVGWLVLFAHVFDGFTTAIGVDVLGTSERSYLPSAIIEFGADLPTEPYLGSAWLFVVVKMLVALLVIVLFAEYVDEHPRRGNLFFAIVAFVGLGPALNNLLLFIVGV